MKLKMLLCLLVGLLSSLASAATPAPAPVPSVLTITKGGDYAGNYSAVHIADTDGKQIRIHGGTINGTGTLLSQSTHKPIDLLVYNEHFVGKAPFRAIELYYWSKFDGEHNRIDGSGGVLLQDGNNNAQSLIWYCNSENHISGATGPKTKVKTSGIQLYKVHCEGRIEGNHFTSTKGDAVEDVCSMEISGGKDASHRMTIINNFVDGQYAYPAGTQDTGSGFMLFDPSGSFNVTDGGFTDCFSNIAFNVGNQCIVSAGGHDIEVANNFVGNDGTNPNASYGLQNFNWSNKTPAVVFGKNVVYHDNTVGMKIGPAVSIQGPATSQNNLAVHFITHDQAVAKWEHACASEHYCVGPLPASAAFVPQVIAAIILSNQPSAQPSK